MKNKKRIFIPFLVVLLLAGLLFFFLKGPSTKKEITTALAPKIKTLRINITDIEEEHIGLIAYVTLENQTRVSLQMDSLLSTFYIENKELAKVNHRHSLHLNANDTSTIAVPLIVQKDKMVALLQKLDAEGSDSVDYTLKTIAYNDHWPNGQVRIESTKHLPLYRIPDIKVMSIKTDRLNFGEAELVASVAFKNNNRFDIRLKDIDYELQIADRKPVKGNIKEALILAAKQTTNIKVPLEIKLKQLAQNIIDLIKQGKNTPYQLKLHATMDSDAQMVKGAKLSITVKGTKDDLDKLKD